MLRTPAELCAGYAEQADAFASLVSTFRGDEWDRATRLPGWSVKDNLSHVAGGAHMLLGRPAPEIDLPSHLTHIRNDVGRWMEYAVEARRPAPGPQVAAELASVGAELVDMLRAAGDDALTATIEGPLGSRPKLGDMLSIALFDWWCHEQDVREALGRPGHVDGTVAVHSRARILGGLRRTLPAAVELDRPVRLVMHVTGPDQATAEAFFGGGDADDAVASAETVTVRANLLTWNALACGRELGAPLHDVIEVDGDVLLAERILAAAPMTP